MMAEAKKYLDYLAEITSGLKKKIARYDNEQAELARRIAEKKAREEAEKLRKEAEAKRQAELRVAEKEREEAILREAALQEQAKAAGVDAPDVEIPEIPEELTKEVTIDDIAMDDVQVGPTKTEEGTSYTVTTWDFELVSIGKVPLNYLKLDESAVKKAIKSGAREIPGLRIFSKDDIRIRTK
jgi:hypothetical protein